MLMKQFKTILTLLLCLGMLSSLTAQNQNITFRSKLSFPGQTVANMSGWAGPDGQEYALVGASKGLIVVNVSYPDAPVKIVQIPGPDNFWKEIKTYGHYAYVVTEGGQGVQIVDLSALPSANLPNKFYKGDGAINNQLNSIHALHIDLAKGFLYAYGSNLFDGGAIVLDIHTDPWNPHYVGKFDQLGYIHDGYVDNDTLYAGHINLGLFSIVDMSDKANPVLLNTQTTPNHFTHNTWLSEDRKTLLTTDETTHSYLASYDVSDPTDIKALDQIQTNPSSGSIVHNTHVLGKYAITAWYTEGVTITDISRPDNLVETGHFDTYPQGSGGTFDGCWGVYPYLPSGNLVAGNINPGELWVLTPSYQPASYLEGKITDASNGLPIVGAQVQLVGNSSSTKTTGTDGVYRTGQATPGLVQVQVSKFGYLPVTTSATLSAGALTILDIALTPSPVYNVEGIVRRADNLMPLPGAKVAILSADISYQTTTDANGAFSILNVLEGTYDIVAGDWGFRYKTINRHITANQQVTLDLAKGYVDDFVFDYGWQKSGTSTEGIWERTDHPLGVNVGTLLSPDADALGDVGYSCYVTGNSSADVDADDVENGTSVLVSPVMDLSHYPDPRITAQVWAVSININNEFIDSIKVYVTNGTEEKLAWERKGDNLNWQLMQFDVTDFVPVSETVQIRVVCFDDPAGGGMLDSYEAAFDKFKVTGITVDTQDPAAEPAIAAVPNPFTDATTISYQNLDGEATLKVFDLAGKLLQSQALSSGAGQVRIGDSLPKGIYLVSIVQQGRINQPLKVVKTK